MLLYISWNLEFKSKTSFHTSLILEEVKYMHYLLAKSVYLYYTS